ncbi:MAG: hypothetical protein K0S22_1003 [Oscillospiraceae bacterium]|jgi:hypothetical protein|nr:hypothetical protein [Oscillospiraceae bacterium]
MKAAFIEACRWVEAIILIITLSACNQELTPTSSISAEDVFSSISPPVVLLSERSSAVPQSTESAATSKEYAQVPAPDVAASASQQLFCLASNQASATPLLADIEKFYARNSDVYTYVGKWVDFTEPKDDLIDFERKLREGIALFEGLTPTEKMLKISDCEFLIWTKDGSRHTFGLAQGDYLVADGKTYQLPQGRAETIRLFHQYILELGKADSYVRAYPQWLVWMTHSNIQEIIYHSPTRGPLTIKPVLIDHIADYAALTVQPTRASTYQLESIDFSGSDVFHLEIRFKTDVVYHIYAKNAGYGGYEADYYVQSSDMPFGCKYRTKLSCVYGAAQFLIDDYEYIANAKSVKDLYNPVT